MTDEQKLRMDEANRWWQYRQESVAFSKEYGLATVRSLILLNGGAIITLLSFLAAGLTSESLDISKVTNLAFWALASFSVGAVLAVITGGLGHLNFVAHAKYPQGPNGLMKYIESADTTEWGNHRAVAIPLTSKAAAFIAMVSIALFVGGAFFSLEILKAIAT